MVILIDENDEPIGEMEKLAAHQTPNLHRAFSVFIFNSEGKLLLQQRALGKYHTPGLWTNTCCSHPQPGEDVMQGAKRRLAEEMGLQADLSFLFKFTYKYTFDNKLTECETDHVFVGYTDVLPSINTEEVNAYKYMFWEDIKTDMQQHPEKYTVWFRIIMENYSHCFKEALTVRVS